MNPLNQMPMPPGFPGVAPQTNLAAVLGAYPGLDPQALLGAAEKAGDPRGMAADAKQEGAGEELPELVRLLMGLGMMPPASAAGMMPPGMQMPPGAGGQPSGPPVGY